MTFWGEISGSHGDEYKGYCIRRSDHCSLVKIGRRFRGAYCLPNQYNDDGESKHL
jgi:hypothetical protein